MIRIRKSNERGHVNHGWLDAHHSFSFASYYDPKHTGFRDLLVINEDRIQPGQGFGKHGHENMEIITYILEGDLAHQDSLGTVAVLHAGDIQRMSAGTGVRHSEFNHSKENPVHLLQIWIAPKKEGIPPSYEDKRIAPSEKKNRLRLIVSPNGEDGSLVMNQDAKLFASLLDEGKSVGYEFKQGRHGWIQVARGSIEVNGTTLEAGDGAAISDEMALQLIAKKPAEFLLFDLP
jgi:redox-sensitive bicupin YhaK (pirin superfamily)